MPKATPLLLLAALLLCVCACPAEAASGLVDYSQTPWGTPRDAVLKKLRRLGPVAKAEHTDTLVVSLGGITTGTRRYDLKGSYLFEQGRLYRIDIRPLSDKGGAIPRGQLADLYRDLVGHHRAEFGSPRLVDGKCKEYANCRRTEWLLDRGRSVLVISEILEPAGEQISVSCYSASTADKLEKGSPRKDTRRGLFPGRKIF